MNEQIKEIINYVNKFRYNKNIKDINPEDIITTDEIYKLVDYITNKLTPEELVNMLNQELVRQNKCYKSKFEKVNEKLNKLDFDNFVYGKTALKDIKKNLQNILNGSDECD